MNETAASKQPALLYLEPTEQWLRNWERMRSGAPFEFLPAPMLALLRPKELMAEDRIEAKLDALKALLPITLTVSNCEMVYSPFNGGGSGSLLVMLFEERLEDMRSALGPFGRSTSLYMDGTYRPHMILTKPLASSKAVRAFTNSIKTYLHRATVEFDSVGLQYGAEWNANSIYEPHTENFERQQI